MCRKTVPFNKPFLTGKELGHIAEAHAKSQLAGDGGFTKRCQGWLEQRTGCGRALLTHSCIGALEMAAFIAEMQTAGIYCVFHYAPLHTAPYERRVGRIHGALPVTCDLADRLVRLPLWLGLEEHQVGAIDTLLHGIDQD